LISFDFGKLGKLRLHRPTVLEIIALVAVLLFIAFVFHR